MTTPNFVLTLARGIEIFTALGRRTAKSWAAKQLQTAVNVGLAMLATPEALAKITDQTIVDDINTMLAEGTITTIDDGTVAAPAPAAKPLTKAQKAAASKAAKAAEVVAPVAEPEPVVVPTKEQAKADKAAAAAKAKADKAAGAAAAKAAKEADAAAAKAEKAATKAAAKAAETTKETPVAAPVVASKAGGVRYGESRPFVCGRVLAEYGVLGGVTDEMVAAVDGTYPEANPRESLFALRNAWHAIRGYMGWVDAATTLASHGVAPDAAPVCVGVRYAESRPYNAGAALATNGLANGASADVLALVDVIMGEENVNPRETAFAARNAWHAIRGYFNINNTEEAVAQDATR